ncbi:unnamed protein product [Closterium sp. Yama58-4]|nr:unnamed protein product [Closterium sp. Yama58-4]
MASVKTPDGISKSASRGKAAGLLSKTTDTALLVDIPLVEDTDTLKKEATGKRLAGRTLLVGVLISCIFLLLHMLLHGITPQDVQLSGRRCYEASATESRHDFSKHPGCAFNVRFCVRNSDAETAEISENALKSNNDDVKPADSSGDEATPSPSELKDVHVFVSTDEADLRPIAVVINSTIMNTRNPHLVFFHLVIPEENIIAVEEKILPLFPHVRIDINRKPIDRERIQHLIVYKEGSKAREELVSVFNFLPFYLPLIAQDLDRIVYLDSDVVVVGDIAELAHVDMGGMAAAAVEDCMQTFDQYFDFNQLAEIHARKKPDQPRMPKFPFDKTACVFNRGVLVMDVQQWIAQNMTESIEWWMQQHNDAKEPLYRYGLSQPPFLLTLYDRYRKLKREWNTRGLGREKFGKKEMAYFERMGLGKPNKTPFLSPWADEAKILHFNGKFKPWKGPRVRPVGEPPNALCGPKEEDCAVRWWKYLSPEAFTLLTAGSKQKR